MESSVAGFADGVAAAEVLILGCDVTDAGMKPDGVVFAADAVEFGGELCEVVDVFEVGPFALDVSPERLDPGLVGRGVWLSEVLPDGQECHVLTGRVRCHLGAVVGGGEQDGPAGVIGGQVDSFGCEQLEEALALECLSEENLDLAAILDAKHQS